MNIAFFFEKSIAEIKFILSLHSQNNDGVVAQLVEQRTENPCVTGSTPVDATKSPNYFGLFLCPKMKSSRSLNS